MATTSGVATPRPERSYTDGSRPPRRSTETKASFKTTEFFAYIAILIGIFIAGAVTKAGNNHNDVFRASQVWLYAAIVTIGYMVSRGLAKAAFATSTARVTYRRPSSPSADGTASTPSRSPADARSARFCHRVPTGSRRPRPTARTSPD